MIDTSQHPTFINVSRVDYPGSILALVPEAMTRLGETETQMKNRMIEYGPRMIKFFDGFLEMRDWCRDNLDAPPVVITPPTTEPYVRYLKFANLRDATLFKMFWL